MSCEWWSKSLNIFNSKNSFHNIFDFKEKREEREKNYWYFVAVTLDFCSNKTHWSYQFCRGLMRAVMYIKTWMFALVTLSSFQFNKLPQGLKTKVYQNDCPLSCSRVPLLFTCTGNRTIEKCTNKHVDSHNSLPKFDRKVKDVSFY